MAQCMAMGQAAGTAARLAIARGVTPREVDPAVREVLAAGGMILALDGPGPAGG
jgi:hypothetical protein